MSRSKRRYRDRPPAPRSSGEETPEGGVPCPSCKTVVRPDDRFCHNCGAALRAAPAENLAAPGRTQPRSKSSVAAFYAVAAGVAALVVAAIFVFGPEPTETPAPAPTTAATPAQGPASAMAPAAAPPAAPAQPPQGLDIAAMNPREAADRLFNRVMMASEQGNEAEAQQFAPMALQAYGRVGALDADAHYHLALIHLVVADIEGARKEIEILRGYSANHLMAPILEHRIAELTDDQAAAARAVEAFMAAYDAEMATDRPEYEAHRNSIERFRETATRPRSESAPPVLPAAASDGAALFAANCARCHGPKAMGSQSGPPLVNKIYEPGHHPDETFLRAVRMGVRSHHWAFGNMPPIDGVTDDQVDRIVAYVRSLQVEAGIQ